MFPKEKNTPIATCHNDTSIEKRHDSAPWFQSTQGWVLADAVLLGGTGNFCTVLEIIRSLDTCPLWVVFGQSITSALPSHMLGRGVADVLLRRCPASV